jgi:acyl-CoA dehydrogenase
MTDAERAFLDRVRSVADELAAPNADDVDRNGRFPQEAVDGLRAARALSAYVPPELGGEGLGFTTIARACEELARRCSATGMVFAMHQIKLGSLVRHAADEPFFRAYLQQVADEQRLISSVTSEVGVGGDMRSSICAVEPVGDGMVRLEKQATTVSYGVHSDDILITSRRAPDAEASDQVLVLLERATTELEQTTTWDSLGMRGTCSPGFVVRATVAAERVVGTPFATIAAASMVPWSHLLWSHVWLGVAGEAFERARAFVRATGRRTPGTVPPMAKPLSELAITMTRMRSTVADALQEYEGLMATGSDELETIGYAIRTNTLKISSSELAPQICHGALQICGMAGYKNDSPFSVGRQYRDALSASLMIANDRIHANNARLWLVHKA